MITRKGACAAATARLTASSMSRVFSMDASVDGGKNKPIYGASGISGLVEEFIMKTDGGLS